MGFVREVGPLPAIHALDLTDPAKQPPPTLTDVDPEYFPHFVIRALRSYGVRNASAPDVNMKAMGLLWSEMSNQQRKEFKKYGWFHTEGDRYRMGLCGTCHSVHVRNYCVHVLGQVPWPDQLLTLKAFAECDPNAFAREINSMPSPGCLMKYRDDFTHPVVQTIRRAVPERFLSA